MKVQLTNDEGDVIDETEVDDDTECIELTNSMSGNFIGELRNHYVTYAVVMTPHVVSNADSIGALHRVSLPPENTDQGFFRRIEQVECSCGWESQDGDLSQRHWEEHK